LEVEPKEVCERRRMARRQFNILAFGYEVRSDHCGMIQ